METKYPVARRDGRRFRRGDSRRLCGWTSYAVGGQPAEPVATQAAASGPVSDALDFSSIVSAYGPAVVNIGARHPGDQSGDGSDPPGSSLGSGFISSSSDGYILANCHVADGADEVTVKLADERTFFSA